VITEPMKDLPKNLPVLTRMEQQLERSGISDRKFTKKT
jgi:hypothetical protein